MKIGKGIRLVRKGRKFTQEKLAEMAGCSTTHIAQIEWGFAYPSIHLLEKIAKVLCVSPTQFYPLSDDPARSELAQHLLNMINGKKISQVKILINLKVTS